MMETLTVGALKKALERIPDEWRVLMNIETVTGEIIDDRCYAVYVDRENKQIILDNMEYKDGEIVWESGK